MSQKAAIRPSVVSKEKEVDVGRRERKGREEIEEAEYEKEECASSSVTSQLFLKPIEKSGANMEKEVVLRRIRQRKRVNKVRAVVGSIFSTTDTNTGPKRWLDDAFAAL